MGPRFSSRGQAMLNGGLARGLVQVIAAGEEGQADQAADRAAEDEGVVFGDWRHCIKGNISAASLAKWAQADQNGVNEAYS